MMARLICKRRLMEREHFSAMGSLLCVKEKNFLKYTFPPGKSKETELCFVVEQKEKAVKRKRVVKNSRFT